MLAPTRDLVAPVANMLMAALVGGGGRDEQRRCDHPAPSGPPGADLSAPVHADPGAGTPPVDGPAIRPGRRSDPPRVAAVGHPHDRCRSGALGAPRIATGGVCRA